MLRKIIIFIISISLLGACFLSGLWLGTINHNFLGDKKKEIINFKTAFLRSFLQKDYKINTISINLDTSNYSLLLKEQDFFSSQKWLDKKLAKYYKCNIKHNNKTYKCKIRNKGLLLKPWEYEKRCYSYKVKLKQNEIYGLSKFYLNYPKKRNYLHEWYGDKIYKYYNLIHQNNFFVNLEINGNKKGLYLLEESFDHKLLTNNSRSLGPIIYYSKTELIKSDNYDYGESFFKSEIEIQYPHKYNDSAKKLLNNFIQKIYPAKKVFDIEKTATHFALADLIGYYHQLNYHNVKFYYDTSKNRLEPIANDFQFYDIKRWTKESFGIVFSKQNNNPNYLDYLNAPWMKILFKNKDFLNLYLEKLNILSNKNKIDSLFSFLNPYEDSAVAIMSTFEPYYYPEVKSIMENNAEHIRNVLKKENPSIILYEIDSNNIFLKIKNFNFVPFKILGIYHNNNLISKFDKNYLIKGKNYGEPIKNEKIKILISEKISFSDSLQLKFQYLGEKTNNIISFKF